MMDVLSPTSPRRPRRVTLSAAYSKRPRSSGGRVWEAPFLPPKSTGNRATRRHQARLKNPSRKTLEALNDRQVGRYLHPTKGWRKVSLRRGAAQSLMAALYPRITRITT